MFKKLSLLVLVFGKNLYFHRFYFSLTNYVFLAIAQAVSIADLPEKEAVEPNLSGGANAVLGTYPYFVAIYAPNNFFLCGGVILNLNHVLTLGTCLMFGDNLLYVANQITVASGLVLINTTANRLTAQALYVHPRTNTFTSVNDIGVIRTVTSFIFPAVPVPVTAPAVINERIIADGFSCQFVGWNLVANVQTQQFLANHPIVNRDICNNLPLNLGRVEDPMICGGLVTAGAGVCQHNRGGALVCNGMVSGILSSGISHEK